MAKTGLSMLDPLELWRDALNKWEGDANSAASKQMGSEDFVRALHAMATVSTGIQQALGKANGALLKELNLPSRADLIEIGARLQRIEEALEQLTRQIGGVAPKAQAPAMPPRTRKPPVAAAAAPIPVAAPTSAPARKRPAARAGRKG